MLTRDGRSGLPQPCRRTLATGILPFARSMLPALSASCLRWSATPTPRQGQPLQESCLIRMRQTPYAAHMYTASVTVHGRADGRGTWRRSAGISVALCVPLGTRWAGGIPKRATEGFPPADRNPSFGLLQSAYYLTASCSRRGRGRRGGGRWRRCRWRRGRGRPAVRPVRRAPRIGRAGRAARLARAAAARCCGTGRR